MDQAVEVEVLSRLRPVGRLLERLVVRRRMAHGLERTMAAGTVLVEREAQAASGGPATPA